MFVVRDGEERIDKVEEGPIRTPQLCSVRAGTESI